MRSLLLVPGLLTLAGAAFAQTFPPVPKTGTVFDGAALLTPDQEKTIASLARDFQRDTGAPIAVATLSSLDRYEAKGLGIQKYSTALFNQWRVGKRSANGGILLVVAKADRKVWVALGSDWRHDYDAKTQGIVRGTITPLFKKGQFGAGIVQGCRTLVRLADAPAPTAENPGSAGPSATPEPFDAAPPQTMASPGGDPLGFFGGGLLCLVLPIFLIVVIVAAARRRGGDRPYGGGFGSNPGPNPYRRYDDPRDDSGDFLAGMVVGQAMSQPPPVYDPNPFDGNPGYDPGPSFDSSPSFDSGSSDSGSSDSGSSDSGSSDSGGSDSGGSFDSGSSDGGGGGGDW